VVVCERFHQHSFVAESAPVWIIPRRRWRLRPTIPAPLLARRFYGSLDVISDSARHGLRPIGASALEVAARTDTLLTELVALPSVRIFQGVHPANSHGPRIPHAVNSGRQLILIESVAWPPGRYSSAESGHILCDGADIGQSVTQLRAAVQHWKRVVPRTHRVTGLVVVHPTCGGPVSLPAPTTELAWTRAADAVRNVHDKLPRGRQKVSRCAVAALAAATMQVG